MPQTHFQLSHFSLHAPSAGVTHWFVLHDFAESLQLDYSRDAARQLEQLLAGLDVRVDHEADAVTLRIKRNEDVIPALRSLYAHVGWDSGELDRIESSVRTFKRPRAKKLTAGDTFLIPIGDDFVGLGQVLDVQHKAPTVAVFRCVGRASDIERENPGALKPLSILHLGLGCSLLTGEWPIIASHRVVHSPSAGRGGARGSIGAISFGGDGYIVQLLRGHAGLGSWEEGFADPNYLRKFVLE